jgi:hypothetical protein
MKLKFRVEMNTGEGNPQPMEMDDNQGGGSSGPRYNHDSSSNEKHDNLGPKTSSGGSACDGKRLSGGAGKQVPQVPQVFLLHLPHAVEQEVGGATHAEGFGTGQEVQPSGISVGVSAVQAHQLVDNSIQEDVKVEEVLSGEDSSRADSMDTNELEIALKEWGDKEEISKPPSAEELAAIPEASPAQSVARRSKRQAGDVDVEVGVVAERRQAIRNEGNTDEPNSLYLAQDSVFISNLSSIALMNLCLR